MNLPDKLRGALRSWTVWFNALSAAAIPALDYAQNNLALVKDFLPQHWYGIALVAIVAGNVALRFKTNNDLSDK